MAGLLSESVTLNITSLPWPPRCSSDFAELHAHYRVDFKHGTVNFNPAGRHQTDKRRVEVPMNSRCRAALEEAVKGALTDHVIEYEGAALKSIKKAIRETAKRSGVPCSPHVFRHTAGVWMAKANVPMQKISQFMGHTSTRVTERIYARYSPSHMRDAADALDW